MARQIAITAILLAVCIASQFFKNLSVYITGPIVNLCLILATMTAGLFWGIALSVITPVTAFLITGNPMMAAVPAVIPLIMLGNAVLVVMVHYLFRPAISGGKPLVSVRAVIIAVLSCLAKGCFMGLTISLWLLPAFLPEKMQPKLPVFQMTFSVTQFVTAVIGFVYFHIVWMPVSKIIEGNGSSKEAD
ncbi:MAG: ECF transporter S component [Lachnospiraceae bacterium]|nr:ECF transporter S component [Lachnospiraceae bacterium]